MKTKIFFMMAMTFVMTTLMVSCDKDDDATVTVVYPPEQPERTPVDVEMNYYFRASSLMLRTLDMTLDYYDATGTLQSIHPDGTLHRDTILNGDTLYLWKNTLSASLATAPIFGMRLNAAIKEGVDTSAMGTRAIRFYEELTYSWNLLDSVGGVTKWDSTGHSHHIDIVWRKLDDFLKMRDYEKGITANGIIFSTNGTRTYKSSWPLNE